MSSVHTDLTGTNFTSSSAIFYQLLSYKGGVDLEAKLDEWERFYNFHAYLAFA
jgi:hypothetical protein